MASLTVRVTMPMQAGHMYTIVLKDLRGTEGSQLVLRDWHAAS